MLPSVSAHRPVDVSMSVIAMLRQLSWANLVAAYTSLMDRIFIDRRASEAERQRASDLAQAVLDGRTTVLEAVRELVSLAHTDAIADVEDRRLIIGIESETDNLPVGEVRKLWAPSALRMKDVEIARCEELYRPQFLEACKRIVGRPPQC
jgi:hypothetical protein